MTLPRLLPVQKRAPSEEPEPQPQPREKKAGSQAFKERMQQAEKR